MFVIAVASARPRISPEICRSELVDTSSKEQLRTEDAIVCIPERPRPEDGDEDDETCRDRSGVDDRHLERDALMCGEGVLDAAARKVSAPGVGVGVRRVQRLATNTPGVREAEFALVPLKVGEIRDQSHQQDSEDPVCKRRTRSAAARPTSSYYLTLLGVVLPPSLVESTGPPDQTIAPEHPPDAKRAY